MSANDISLAARGEAVVASLVGAFDLSMADALREYMNVAMAQDRHM